MKTPKQAGFTRLELALVLCTLSVLFLLAVPTLANNAENSKAVLCIANKKQITSAWLLYSNDNNDFLVENYGSGSRGIGSSWATGWLDYTISSDNTNLLFLTTPRYAKLSTYLESSIRVFKCPEDNIISTSQHSRGWSQRVRSISMNSSLGMGNASIGSTSIYSRARRMSDLLIPGPTDTFVFTDEHPDSINDPFLLLPFENQWPDVPGNYHEGGSTFSFADGRVELHKWAGQLRILPIRLLPTSYSETPGSPDISWVSYRSVRKTEESY